MTDVTSNPIQNYQAAVTANPNSAEAHCNLGWGYYGQHQYEQAIQAFHEALALEAHLNDAHYGLALTLKEAGSGPEAVAEFQTVLKLAPQDANQARGQMLARLAQGHINRIQSGNWDLPPDTSRNSG